MSKQTNDYEMYWNCCCGETGESLSEFEKHLKSKKHKKESQNLSKVSRR